MSAEARDWLPLSALGHPTVRRAVADAVEAWSQAWLPGRRLAILSWTPLSEDRREDQEGAGWRLWGRAVALSVARRAGERLAGWALDERLEDLALSDTDRRLVDGLRGRLIGDLVGRVEQALGLEPLASPDAPPRIEAPLGSAGVVIGLAEGAGSALLSLAVPDRVLLPFIKAALPPPRRAERPVAARPAAVGDLPVRLRASLGGAELSLEDLRGLAPNDVLKLDRKVADGALLVVAEGGASVARAAVGDAGGHITLTLQSPK